MLLLIQHKVADFAKWKSVFEEHESTRRKHGAARHWLHRSTDDSNDITVAIQFPSVDKAKGFVNDPSLREAMVKAGVQGQPQFSYLDDPEEKTY